MALNHQQRSALFVAQCNYILNHLQQHGWAVLRIEDKTYLRVWECTAGDQMLIIRAQYHGDTAPECTFEIFQRWAAAGSLDSFLAAFDSRG